MKAHAADVFIQTMVASSIHLYQCQLSNRKSLNAKKNKTGVTTYKLNLVK